MPKQKKKGGKDIRVHCPTWGTARPLCGAKSGKTNSDPRKINCEPCARVAVRLAEGIDERGREREAKRQERALASLQEPRWWEKDPADG